MGVWMIMFIYKIRYAVKQLEYLIWIAVTLISSIAPQVKLIYELQQKNQQFQFVSITAAFHSIWMLLHINLHQLALLCLFLTNNL